MFGRLARLVNAVPWGVVVAGALFAAVAGVFGGGLSSSLESGGFQDPGSESTRGVQRLEAATGLRADGGVVALVSIPDGAAAATSKAQVNRVSNAMLAQPEIASVLTFYSTQSPSMLSRDGRSTTVTGYWKNITDQQAVVAQGRLAAALNHDPKVKLGGFAAVNQQLNVTITSDLQRAELMAFPVLFLLSLWVFRGVVAAMLPPLVGGIVIVGSFLLLRGVTEVHGVSIFALNLATGMGLGLAIDYSLFMVSRYREEMAGGADPPTAIATMLRTAGRTVMFSSFTIAAAVGSLTVFPINFLWSMGIAGVIVALTACVVSLTFLPAVLRLLGPRINALALPAWRRAATAPPTHAGFWYRFSRFVMGRPLPIAVLSAAFLIALGLPFLRISFTSVDQTDLPPGSEARIVSEALTRDFGAPAGSTIFVVAEAPETAAEDVSAFASTLQTIHGVSAVQPGQYLGRDTWQIVVHVPTGNYDASTVQVVKDIRAQHAPFTVLVSGAAAQFVDLQSALATHLPVAVALVAGVTVILLFLLTGSVVLPVKAVVMNLLTLSVAFGVLVLVFQDGRLEDVLRYTSKGALESTQPVLLFAIVFGLSTDYGVFLLTRIKEAHDSGASNREAVATGIQRTGRIITAAALLFCVAIGSFATSQIVFLKELGIGIAVGVAVDATIVRALLVPSLMALLGTWNWYAPRPLRWLHDRAALVEGAAPRAA